MTTPEVEKPVTIAVLGAHSTGKSTFLARLAHDLRRHHITVATVADLGQAAQRIGLPILTNHTWASTLWIITRGISEELQAWPHSDVVLIDRPAPDALGYYRAALDYRQDQPDPTQTAKLETLVHNHSDHYDLLFRTTLDPTIPLGDNKTRDNDTKFRLLADKHLGHVLHDLHLPHELLPADGHDTALDKAINLVTTQLTTGN
ncbi:AAA family ATPase [Actinokineospora sp. NPDC004072]